MSSSDQKRSEFSGTHRLIAREMEIAIGYRTIAADEKTTKPRKRDPLAGRFSRLPAAE
jgi:hypothetical protein